MTTTGFAWTDFRGVLFDLDGVITPTAEVHERAWARLFAAYDFVPSDYVRFIDGRPRYDGVRTFLASRGVELDEGSPDDMPGTSTVAALGNRKNELFRAVIAEEGVVAYPGSVATIDHLGERGVEMGVVSSSKNAVPVLDAAGLGERFEVVIDGIVAADEGLAGKPAPDTFLRGAERLGVAAAQCVVVEDATSGVAAGRAGGFALVIGVDRGAGREALVAHGADLVVDDLAELLPSGDS